MWMLKKKEIKDRKRYTRYLQAEWLLFCGGGYDDEQSMEGSEFQVKRRGGKKRSIYPKLFILLKCIWIVVKLL